MLAPSGGIELERKHIPMNTEFKFDGMPPYPQGELRFVELLKKHIPFVPHWDETSASKNTLDLKRGVYLQIDFPDPEQLLTSAYGDFQRFLRECGLDGKSSPLAVRHLPALETDCGIFRFSFPVEMYRTLYAGDTTRESSVPGRAAVPGVPVPTLSFQL